MEHLGVKMDRQKTFSVDIEVKEIPSTSDDVIVLEGWANKFVDESGNIIKDRDGESVFPMGIDLEEYKVNPVILYQHDMRQPVGKAVDISTSDKGVYIKCEIYKELNPVAFAAAKRGVINSFSIGFKTLEDTWDDARKLWLLIKTKLFEVSLVSIPANQYSQFTVVKSADGTPMLARKEPEVEQASVIPNIVIEHLSKLTEEMKELRKVLEEKAEEAPEVKEETPEPEKEEPQGEPAPAQEEKGEESVPTPPTLDEQLGAVLEQISAENFDTIYAFHSTLTDKLDALVTSAISQSQN